MIKPYEKIIQLFKDDSIYYQEFEHEPVYTIEQMEKASNATKDSSIKTMMVKQNDNFVLIVMSGRDKFDNKKIKILLGVKEVRLASPEDVRHVMNCEVGACHPFGELCGLNTYIDKKVLDQKKVSINPAVHNKTIEFSLDNFLKISKYEIADISKDLK
ncbi:MAG: YbaK/EbsC family protein [Patescibacteria group bacterium]|jgi:Ala-tRNA(Pro) deacylase